jgi:hypothetical protein
MNEDTISVQWLLILLSDLKVQSSQGKLRLLLVKAAKSVSCCLLQVGFLLGLYFNPEDRGDIFPQNVHRLSSGYIALYSRRQDTFSPSP